MPYLIEIVAATDAAGTTTTLRAATGRGYRTGPSDTPANAVYLPRIKHPGNFERHLFSAGTTSGTSEVGYGYIELVNADGGLDGWLDYGFDGRAVTIRRGPHGGAYPADFPVVAQMTAERLEVPNLTTVRLIMRDDLALVRDKVLNGAKFAGTNSGSDGVEGTADDIKGDNKPIGYGIYRNISPVLCNSSKYIYMMSLDTGQAAVVDAVYDMGAFLNAGTTQRATVTALEANAPVAGGYDWCYEAGKGLYVRLGSIPTGAVTADATEGTNAAARYPAQMSYRAHTGPGGQTSGNFDLDTLGAVDTACPWACGWWTDDEATVGDFDDAVLGPLSIGCVPNSLGVFQYGIADAPSGTAAHSWGRWELLGFEFISSSDEGEGLPAWQMTVEYQRNYTVQDAADVAGVALSRLAWLENEYRSTDPAEDATVKDKYANAVTVTVTTAIDSAADAAAFRDWRFARDKVQRRFSVLKISSMRAGAADLGLVVQQTLDRFGWNSGKSLRVLGISQDFSANATLIYGYC